MHGVANLNNWKNAVTVEVLEPLFEPRIFIFLKKQQIMMQS